MPLDDLEALTAERSKNEPGLPDLIRAAERRRELGKRLTVLREETDLSQTKVAASMSSSQSVVSKVESGADVRLSTLQKYAQALGKQLRIEVVDAPKRRPIRKRRSKKKAG